jgi:hypothetical protein
LTDQQQTQDLTAIKEQLLLKFPTVAPQSWRLNIRFLRSNANPAENKTPPDTQYILRFSHYGDQAFLAIESGEDFPVISIPSDQMDTFVKLITDKFNTLWSVKMLFAVTNGASYEVDDVTIRLGELRAPGPSQAIRGIICNVQISSSITLHASQEKTARLVVTDVADTLGFTGAKKYFRSWASDDTSEEVKLWCNALSQRL